MSQSNIKAKIAALLAKAEGTDNPFEAATFMAKVNELLEKHQIDMYEIRQHGQESADPLGSELGGVKLFNTHPWARLVANALANYYGCRFWYYRQGNHIIYTIVGRESARTTFELMFPFVLSQIRQAAKKLFEQYQNVDKSRAVWEREVGSALAVRIWTMVPDAEKKREELSANALVPVTDVDAYLNSVEPGLKQNKARPVNTTAAARDAAVKISIHHQATGKHVKLLS